MADLVRVRTESGAEVNVNESIAKRNNLEILDETAWKAFNTPRAATRNGGRRPKKKTTVAEAAAAKKAATEPAGTEGEAK
jgi:hypothetical protein